MLGRVLMSVCALGLIFGSPIADFSASHQFNPRWPPHAKFHNAQTITMSIILGFATLYNAWKPLLVGVDAKTAASAAAAARHGLDMAAFTGAIYWFAGLVAILYPNVSGLDPEFGGPGFPQGWLFAGFLLCAVGGWALER